MVSCNFKKELSSFYRFRGKISTDLGERLKYESAPFKIQELFSKGSGDSEFCFTEISYALRFS